MKLTKPKKVSVSKLKKKLLELVKKYVKDRDENICQYCHKTVFGSNCHVSHVIPVSHGNRLAFDPMNMKVLCYHHHLNWWHKNPIESGEWFKETFPKRHAYLEKHKQEKVNWKAHDYERMIEEWKNKEPSL